MGDAPVVGIDADNVTQWFVDHVAGVHPPLTFDLVAGGRSNLTFKVTDADGATWALRRPPTGHVLPTAHDMAREHRIIDALSTHTDVPVATPYGLCTDEAVNGAPFYVMDFVDGLILRDAATAERLTADQRRIAGDDLVDVLVRIHDVDVDAVGLGDLGRRDGYIERQLKRWYGQYEKSKMGEERPLIDEMHDRLLGAVPEQQGSTIVHGDYRLDNTMLGFDGRVAAVLDWEICTLGDPLADVGLLMVYWPHAGEEAVALGQPATMAPGFPTREEVMARYAERSGRDLSQLDFYVALGYWKLAIILEGVYARYAAGGYGKVNDGIEAFARLVERLAEAAAEAVP
jgi:aminoglycoside phosphotransferase (APT) family kinase protein